MLASFLVARQRPDAAKLSPMSAASSRSRTARGRFDVRYLVAILFIIFDLEVAFLFPWAVIAGQHRPARLLVDDDLPRRLTVGFIYEWKKGALEWE